MKKRNPILSFVLSILTPGLGQVYNGQIRKGIFLFLAIFPVYLLFGLLGGFNHFWSFATISVVIILYRIAIAMEAYYISKSIKDYTLKPFNKAWIYTLLVLIGLLLMWYGTKLSRHLIGYEGFTIPTPSMEPSVRRGDRIMALSISQNEIQAGDIVTFSLRGQTYMSRVIGFPGDKIEVIDDKVFINDIAETWNELSVVNEEEVTYQVFQSTMPQGYVYDIMIAKFFMGKDFPKLKTSNMTPLIVPENEVFLIADNRSASFDSRNYGTVPIETIEKKLTYIYWSNDWKRIGLRLVD